MKSNWLTNFLVLLVGSLILTYPLGYYYGIIVNESEAFLTIDPNHLFPGFMMALNLLAGFLATYQRNFWLILINIFFIVFNIWGGAPDGLRLDIYAAIAGLVLGFIARALFVKTRSKE